MSEAVFNAATVGGQLFGIQTFSGIINTFNSDGNVEKTEYYICIDKNHSSDPLNNGPDTIHSDFNYMWKRVGIVKVKYDVDGNAEKIWRAE